MLLAVDYLINGPNSFVSLFPEFTSYINTLSNAPLTVISNPVLYSGPYYNQFARNQNIQNLRLNTTNTNMTNNEWYYSAILNMCYSYMNNNVNNIGICSLPYYGEMNTAQYGDIGKLERDLKEKNNVNIIGMDWPTIFKKFFINQYKDLKTNEVGIKKSDLIVLDHLDQLYNFENTDTGVFRYYYSQIAHQQYSFKENGRYVVKDTNYLDYIRSQWYAIQKIKDILIRLKKEPFVDQNNQPMYDANNQPISVYDKTMFIITSDHGFSLIDDSNKFFNYLISKNIMSSNSYRYIANAENFIYNNLFIIKNFKYDINNNQISNKTKFNVDQDKIIFIGDVPFIIENYLKQYNLTKNTNSLFVSQNPKIASEYSEIAGNSILINPLDSNMNSIMNNTLINRQLYMSTVVNWRFFPKNKLFSLNGKKKFKLANGEKYVFSNKNFTNLA